MIVKTTAPDSKALRRGRVSLPNQIYLVTTICAGRAPMFREFDLGRQVIAVMRELDQTEQVHSIAWVIMPDHVHWLFQLLEKDNLAQVMRHFKGRSARRINRLLGRSGPLWQSGYHDHALRKEEDIKQLSRYIVANPLRAGCVENIGDYPLWDSIWL